MRIAAIDIGSNSIRATIVETTPDGAYRVIDDEREQTRLAEGLAERDSLSAEAIERTLTALERLLALVRSHKADVVRAVATAAVRSAANGQDLARAAEERLGLTIEIISAAEEGRLAFVSAARHFELAGPVVVMDIGGGSLEVVRATGREIERIESFPLGSVVMSERLTDARRPIPPEELKDLRKHVRRELRGRFGHPEPVALVVGSGGTVTTIAEVTAKARREEFEDLQGYEFTQADVVHRIASLAEMDQAARAKVPGLPPYRADVIVAGMVVVREVMRLFSANRMAVNTQGLREGLVLDMLARADVAPETVDRMVAVRDFGVRCGYDRIHAQQVARLALSLYDGLALPRGRDRELLEVAATLHDVGYYIDYAKHHRHSRHLIAHASLPGLTPRERDLVATIARYHTGAMPKLRHDEYARLGPEDRARVDLLGGILRLADGLDRGRVSRVRDLRVMRSAEAVTIEAVSTDDLTVEVYGALKKSDLLAHALGVPVQVTGVRE
ncbi:MAG: Ppx/GppA phosphatase family protein [Coriobacteriales bacterium]